MAGRSVYAQPPGPVATSVPYIALREQSARGQVEQRPHARPRYHTSLYRGEPPAGVGLSINDLSSSTLGAFGGFGRPGATALPVGSAPMAGGGECDDCG